MWVLETVAVAFSLYSVFPVPQVPWNERNLRWMLCAFPLVGLAVGLVCQGWGLVCDALSLPTVLRGGGWTLLPVVLTGGIHLDGYADTADALSSHAPVEKKREILKDPRCGAFAVIALCAYFTGTFALCTALADAPGENGWPPMIPALVLSRALSGAALTILPLAEGSGLARTFAEAADRRQVRVVLIAEAVVTSVWLLALDVWAGLAMLAAAVGTLVRYARTAVREFGGTSGDLAGWFLQKAEFWMLLALVLVRYGEAKL